MIEQSRLILIGGTMRNVGKTTLATHLIKRYAKNYPVIGLKVTSIYPDDSEHHGNHSRLLKDNYSIEEEKDLSGRKDTSKMLLAGAHKVYYIRTHDLFIPSAFEEFNKMIPKDAIIICESISLRHFVRPGLFILIRFSNPHKEKKSAKILEPYADKVIHSNGERFDFDIDRIIFKNNKWEISRNHKE